MFSSRFFPCESCGASIDPFAAVGHRCSSDRFVESRMFALREQIARFETQLRDFLETPRGHFEVWAAARRVRGEVGDY